MCAVAIAKVQILCSIGQIGKSQRVNILYIFVYSPYIADMKKHMDNIHCRPTYQGCDFGNKKTTFCADMKDHNENMHIPGTYRHCVFCSKPYPSSANMKTHIKFIYSQGTY